MSNPAPADQKYLLTAAQAIAMLPDDTEIHTFVQAGNNPMLLGADWTRAEVIAACHKDQPQLAGPIMTAMKHGLAIIRPDIGPVFIATKQVAPCAN